MESGRKKKHEPERMVGEYDAHPNGFGFVKVEGEDEDIFIPSGAQNHAVHRDLVEVELTGEKGRLREGRVMRIVEHQLSSVVGTFQYNKNFGFVLPDDPRLPRDIFIPKERMLGASDGQKVVVEITSFGEDSRRPEGAVTKVLGSPDDPGVDVECIIRSYDVPDAFSKKNLNQAERVAKPVSEADRAGRSDFRDWLTVTIDGEDAKDLDDAVTLTETDGVYTLGVHIADVANYVQEDSALDREALKRGTSIYLADRVIPMLPPKLCNGICSLNQGEDRLTLSCVMKIDANGNMLSHKIVESVINVNHRMNYTDVDRIISDHDEKCMEKYEDCVPMFFRMKKLSEILREKRQKRGAIDFDLPESQVDLDGQGHPVDVYARKRNPATKLIEDFMLTANETVAEHFYWMQIPFLYRIHEAPDPERIRELNDFLIPFGCGIRGSSAREVHPGDVRRLLEKIKGRPEETMISMLTLRSMQKARYSTDCAGHFGLAARFYCHFTSPIRRYPDLQIHRIIKDCLRGRMKTERMEHYRSILNEVADRTSSLERRADEMERETMRLKKAEYMVPRIGREYDGIITGITEYGMYVELPNTVEGLVHVSTMLDDYYEFLEDQYELVGEHSGIRYCLGMPVHIRVSGADIARRTVDFELTEDELSPGVTAAVSD